LCIHLSDGSDGRKSLRASAAAEGGGAGASAASSSSSSFGSSTRSGRPVIPPYNGTADVDGERDLQLKLAAATAPAPPKPQNEWQGRSSDDDLDVPDGDESQQTQPEEALARSMPPTDSQVDAAMEEFDQMNKGTAAASTAYDQDEDARKVFKLKRQISGGKKQSSMQPPAAKVGGSSFNVVINQHNVAYDAYR
jgi:hypothetical protein